MYRSAPGSGQPGGHFNFLTKCRFSIFPIEVFISKSKTLFELIVLFTEFEFIRVAIADTKINIKTINKPKAVIVPKTDAKKVLKIHSSLSSFS